MKTRTGVETPQPPSHTVHDGMAFAMQMMAMHLRKSQVRVSAL